MEVEDGRSLLGGFADGFDGFGLGCGSLISLGSSFSGGDFGLCGAEGLGFGAGFGGAGSGGGELFFVEADVALDLGEFFVAGADFGG